MERGLGKGRLTSSSFPRVEFSELFAHHTTAKNCLKELLCSFVAAFLPLFIFEV